MGGKYYFYRDCCPCWVERFGAAGGNTICCCTSWDEFFLTPLDT